jgi:anion-transporting  ArsA/GET3 family ATPase
MKGIYLSEEGKKAIEDKIDELEVARREHEKVEINMFDYIWAAKTSQAIDMLKEILSSATILPVEDNWDIILKLYLME